MRSYIRRRWASNRVACRVKGAGGVLITWIVHYESSRTLEKGAAYNPGSRTELSDQTGATMRHYYDIDLGSLTITKRELEGEAVVKAGRYFIAKTLLELGAATVDPLSPANPLIFSAGPFSGSSFSNANRTSVGCKSPLTGGVKEANGGGTFSYGLGQQK